VNEDKDHPKPYLVCVTNEWFQRQHGRSLGKEYQSCPHLNRYVTASPGRMSRRPSASSTCDPDAREVFDSIVPLSVAIITAICTNEIGRLGESIVGFKTSWK
jgi:hypothetical protein